MSPVSDNPRPAGAPTTGWLCILIFLYVLLVLAPILLRLLGLTRVATWPWRLVLSPFWVPWMIVTVLSAAGWLLRLVEGSRRG